MMAAPRVLYISNSHAVMYEWHGGRLLAPVVFKADVDGQDAFEQYVKTDTGTVVSVLVDIVEEEFRNELVPHVSGRDHAILVRRRAEQAFRLTPYRLAVVQGRRPDGKREDEVLLSGLTNPEPVKPWLEILNESKVPVAGMYSVAQLAGDLLKPLKVDAKCALLMTRQEFGGLRQSFFRGKQLKISRQTPAPTGNVTQYAEQLFAEVNKTQRYLTRLKLVDRDDVLHVHVLCDDGETAALRAACRDQQFIQFHFHSLTAALTAVTAGEARHRYGEPLYVHLLRANRPKLDYSTSTERRYNIYRGTRIALYALSVAVLVGGTVWAGANVIDLQLMREYSSTANRVSDDMQDRYQRVLADIPKTPVSPPSLRIGVDIAHTLMDRRILPHAAVYALSRALHDIRGVRVHSIEWIPTNHPEAVVPGVDQNAAGQQPPEAAAPDTSGETPPADAGMYHVALLRAEIKPFDGDYKQAFETVTRLVDALKRNANVTEAAAVDLPLSTRSTDTLQGKAGLKEQDFSAQFSVRAVLKVKHDAR